MRITDLFAVVNLLFGLFFSFMLIFGPGVLDRSMRWGNPPVDMGVQLLTSGLAFRTAIAMRRSEAGRWHLQLGALASAALAVFGVSHVIP